MSVHRSGTTIKPKLIACIIGGLFLSILVFLGQRSEPYLRFLNGRSPNPNIRSADVYRFAADYNEIRRETDLELTKHGFTQVWDIENSGGHTIGYRSRIKTTEIYLVERSESPGQVEVWIDAEHGNSKLRQFLGAIGLAGHNHFKCGQVNACIANLKQIDGAKANWAMEGRKSTNDVPCDSDLFGINAYIDLKPVCPAGGVYRLGTAGEPPTCTFPLHALQ